MPSRGFRKLSPALRDTFRSRYLAGEESRNLLKEFPYSESLFWLTVRDLREERVARVHASTAERLRALPLVDLGWIAGIIDGEGWIGISRLQRGYFQPRIDVTSTTRCMQQRLKDLIGGHVSHTKHVTPLRDTWRWSMWSITGVRAVLEVVKPYFVVKQKVATEVLRFCERHAREGRCTPTRHDERTYARVRALNRRGRDG